AVAKKAIYEDREEIVVFFIRGSDTLQETKAINAVGALDLEDASEEELEREGLVPYFIGPLNEKFKFVIDEELRDEENLICGGNKKDYHYVGFDFKTLKNPKYADLIEVKEGDRCPKCGGELIKTRGIEVGHIFQLGERYSEPLNATFLDENGKAKPFVMGTYGIGVSRLVAVIIEQHHDDKGCIWTKTTAPYLLDIVVSDPKNGEQLEFAENLYNKLKNENKEVIIDDRKERFGFKMKDFELIGFPYALIVGKGLKDGIVQLVDRKTLEKEDIPIDKLDEKIAEIFD
ncbi:MAG: proline--tRNA ligase, partial [Epsilonproteobacteria bacterium]|nr:proline--tRNA ligase [Campylobacterota bacterium]